jgi:arsenite transporter
MSFFERTLSLWVGLCIVIGIGLGHLLPGAFHTIGAAEMANVNLPVAVLIWLMIVPLLNKSRPWYERGRQPRRARPVENQRRG